MAAVLERELASYQRALDLYQRELADHNRKVKSYNDSIVKDANGRALVQLPDGKFMAVPEGGGQLVEAKMPEGIGYNANDPLGQPYDPKKYVAVEVPDSNGVKVLRTVGGAQLQSPGDWDRTFDRRSPGLTAGQERGLVVPGAAAQARGLIGEVIAGNGIHQYFTDYGNYKPGPNPVPGTAMDAPYYLDFNWTPPAPAPAPAPAPGAFPTALPGTPEYNQQLAAYTTANNQQQMQTTQNQIQQTTNKQLQDTSAGMSPSVGSNTYVSPLTPAPAPTPIEINWGSPSGPSTDPFWAGYSQLNW